MIFAYFYCVQGMCLSEALRLVVILERAALEKGRPDLDHWVISSLRTVHCLTWPIATQGELVGSRVLSSVAESVPFSLGREVTESECKAKTPRPDHELQFTFDALATWWK